MQALPQRSQDPSERRAFQTALIIVVIIFLCALMAFTANPGKFEPMVLLFGILVAALAYYLIRTAAPTQGESPPPGHLCSSCSCEVSTGANFCPRCGARLG